MSASEILGTIWKLLSLDFHSFKAVFPHTWLALFIIIRVLPWFAFIPLWPGFLKLFNKSGNLLNTLWSGIVRLFGKLYILLNNRSVFIFSIVLAWFLLRILFLATPLVTNFEGDAASRIELSNDWMQKHQGIPGGLIWLPLHFYLLMLPSFFGMDIATGSRLITLLFSLLTLPVLYLLVKKRFGEPVALITCFLLALNPFHIKYSVISMTEVPFLFFIFAGLFFLYKFIEEDKIIYLILSSMLLNCSNLIRFEGWIVSALLPWFLLYYRKRIKYFFVFGCLNAISILLYMAKSYLWTGDPLFGLTMSDKEVRYHYAAIQNIPQHIMNGLSSDSVLPFWMLALLLPAIWFAIKNKKELPWLVTSLLLLAAITWKVLTATCEPAWRYFSTGLLLILPFIAWSIKEWMPANKKVRFTLLLAALFFFSWQIYRQYDWMVQQRYLPAGFLSSAQWIKEHRKPGEKYLFDSNVNGFVAFRLLTNTRPDEMYFPHYPGMKKFSYYENFTDTVFLRVLQTPGYRYVVYQTGLQIDSVFHLPQIRPSLLARGLTLDSVYADGKFRIYEVGGK